jgi:hypothetical protein
MMIITSRQTLVNFLLLLFFLANVQLVRSQSQSADDQFKTISSTNDLDSNYLDESENEAKISEIRAEQSSSRLSEIDLEELSPGENNCRLEKSPTNNNNNNSVVVCSKIPLFCQSVCDSVGRIDFDSNLKRLSPFSFGSYKIRQSLELNFPAADLKRIDSDAFNGLVIEPDAILKLNFDGLTTGTSASSADFLSGDSDLDEQRPQIESDLQTPSTKADPLVSSNKNKNFPTTAKTPTLTLLANSFRGLKVKERGQLIINIKNYARIEFQANSLNFMKQLTGSGVTFNMEKSTLVVFRSKCADSWRAYQEDDLNEMDSLNKIVKSSNWKSEVKDGQDEDEPDEDDDNDGNNQNLLAKTGATGAEAVVFKLSLANIERVIFEKESFSNMRLFDASIFQIELTAFDECTFGVSAFENLYQQRASTFELNLTAGRRLHTAHSLLADLTQSPWSKLLLHFGITESNVCLGKSTFENLIQGLNSTVRVTFLMNEANSIVFNKESFAQVKQEPGSVVQIYVLRVNELLVASEAIEQLNQSRSSSFEIWVSKAKANFSLAARAFTQVRQAFESSIRIGFTSSPEAVYVQSPLAFDQFTSAPRSEVVYDFTQGSRFSLGFSARPIPRIFVNGGPDASVEETTLRLFPELGRLARPDRISLQDYKLDSDADFCQISAVPFDVLVKLNPTTECSCAVYYLYRILRRVKAPNDTEWLASLPECYRDKYLSKEANPGLGKLEEMCKFKDLLENCRKLSTLEASSSSSQRLNGDMCPAEDVSFEYFKNTERKLPPSASNLEYSFNSAVDEDDDDEDDDDIDDSSEDYDFKIENQKKSFDSLLYVDSSMSMTNNKINNNDFIESNSNDENDEDDEDDDDEDDDDDDDDDDDNDDDDPDSSVLNTDLNSADYNQFNPTLGRVGDLKYKLSQSTNSIRSLFSVETISQLFKNSTVLGLFIVGLTSVVLILIVVVILIIIFKLKYRRKSGGFSIYYDEDDEDEPDGGELDYSRVGNVTSGGDGDGTFKQKHFNYTLFENSQNECADASSVNKLILVKCETAGGGVGGGIQPTTRGDNAAPAGSFSSVKSSVVEQSDADTNLLPYDEHHLMDTSHLINIKPNPLGNL